MRRILAVLLLVLASVAPAAGGVVLRFDPADQALPLSGQGSLSILLDDTLDVRTIEVWVDYDATRLQSVDGVPGFLYDGAPCYVWPEFDDATPGEWFGSAVTIGYDCWVTGPGELFRWDFAAVGEGVACVVCTYVRLFDPGAELIADVSLPPTHVLVGATDAPAPPTDLPRLALHPNPFNPATRLRLAGEGPARLTAHDVAGRRLAVVWEGQLDGERALAWRARDGSGRDLPAGVYLLRLETPAGCVTRRAVLIK
ncbi:MAG: hypothetical protein JW819_09165 [Candidatus Krumholzibacteriota bacterium]|nr:hypothetical protein [Candidatus Krumholzibacteriota bacterium]